ncbi:MAG: amidohydrolase [Gammaproteobacteria bacterium]|nr:amidohydrolase [Gammaproteobacteria bacterium]
MKAIRAMGCLACLAFMTPIAAFAGEQILVNGHVFTANPRQAYAEAVSVRDGRIVAVGTRTEATASVGADAVVTDLGGQTLLPGLIDSHVHAVFGGIGLLSADARNDIADIAALEAFVAEAKRSGRGMNGDVLVVTGVPLGIWSQNAALNERFNGGTYAGQPLFLRGMDGHTGWSNAALRKRAGLDKSFIAGLPEEKRKYYGIGDDLTPNGFAVDEGLEIVEKQIPPVDARKSAAGARAAVEYLHSLGITSWLDPWVDESTLAAYRDLAAAGGLSARVAALPVVRPDDPQSFKDALALREKFGGIANLSIPGVKVFADGVVEYPSQSAAMTRPYANTGKTGDLLFKPEKFAKLCIEADKLGLFVHTHAIGDLAVHEALNGYEAMREANGDSGLPGSITHLQFIRPDDIGRFKPLGVLASYQLLWAAYGIDSVDLVKPYVAEDIFPWQYPARSMLESGAVIAGASDWPVSTPDVFKAIYQAETRKGETGEVLIAGQVVPRELMLYAYTINAARVMNQEDVIGSIEPGKAADFVLVDRDVLTVPAEQMRDTKVLGTMVAGDWVYRAN